MKKVISAIIALIISLTIFSCAGRQLNPQIVQHKHSAEQALLQGQLHDAMKFVDLASNACNDAICFVELYRWMIDLGSELSNDIFRAKGFESLTLFFLQSSFEKGVDLKAAKDVAGEFLKWGIELHESRGDIFPLSDALLLSATVSMLDRPDSSLALIGDLHKLRNKFPPEKVPAHLINVINQANVIVEEIQIRMRQRKNSADLAFEEGQFDKYLSEMLYAYRASAALGETIIAAESAISLAEYFGKLGETEIAAEWISAAIKWKGEKYRGNQPNNSGE